MDTGSTPVYSTNNDWGRFWAMADVLNFKCPCCGANLPFNGKAGELVCEHCEAHFTMEQAKAAEEAELAHSSESNMVWSTADQQVINDENGKVKGYKCPNCGAEMAADENTAATECPYCGNPAVIPQSFEGFYRPDLVVPFSIDKRQAIDSLLDFTKGKKLLPKTFTDRNRLEEITGLYVPFWLFSCHANGFVTYDAVKEERSEDANYRYVKKDHYTVVRKGEMDFERIPVDAATRMDDNTMDSLEPYDFTKAVEYDAAYFSGYLADKYDVDQKDAVPRANERVKNTFKTKMREAVKDYKEVIEKAESIQLSNTKAEYAMLPVWLMSTSYEGKVYSFGINGQSGKMVGSLPVDKGKKFKYLCIGTLIAFAILSVLAYFLGASRGFTAKGETIAFVIALIIGLIYSAALKASMNTVSKKYSAGEYLLEKSLKMGVPVDRFIFTKTEKTAKTTKQ